jgi:hypothetical protein
MLGEMKMYFVGLLFLLCPVALCREEYDDFKKLPPIKVVLTGPHCTSSPVALASAAFLRDVELPGLRRRNVTSANCISPKCPQISMS